MNFSSIFQTFYFILTFGWLPVNIMNVEITDQMNVEITDQKLAL